jgi:Na+-driven multidrug efflux pump
MNFYSVGIVVHVAMQSTAAALIAATRAKEGIEAARKTADRMFAWGTIVGTILGAAQYFALPLLVPLFSTLPEVRDAVRAPAVIASMIHVVNGIVFAGEGIMLGLGSYRDLALLTAGGTATLVALLSTPLGTSLEGILTSMALFCAVQGISVLAHYLRIGPLSAKHST